MKSAILDKGEYHYTNMDKLFRAIENEQLKYNWLITDYECYSLHEETNELFSEKYVWISGDKLTEVIARENLQFIWGVFSGFHKEVPPEEVLKHELPFADGNKNFWVDNVKLQHPLAETEIVAFDSSFTLFISKHDDLVEKFMHYFPLSENLSARNKMNNIKIVRMEECKFPVDDIIKTQIAALYEQVFNETYPALKKSPEKCLATVEYWFKQCEKVFLVYSKYDGNMVGFMILGDEFVDELYLHADFHGKGIGTVLINIAKEHYNKLCLYTLKQNKNAISFYLKQGFTIVKYGVAPDEQVEDVYMEWERKQT